MALAAAGDGAGAPAAAGEQCGWRLAGAQQHEQEQQLQRSHCAALAQLWRQQQLCDTTLTASGGEALGAHRVVLAAGSGFFRALFCGAGQAMREGAAAAAAVPLPYSRPQLMEVLSVLYDHRIQVCSANVSWLIDMASYLEVAPLLDACCAFLRGALSPETCVDVLLLAHQYHCGELQAQGVSYLAQHLPSLLLVADGRQRLCRLPHALLAQVLSCEQLEAEKESDLLCLLADWVCAAPAERCAQLGELLALLQLQLLPEEACLSRQQLNACATPAAEDLAQQLHRAAVHCQRARSQGLRPPAQQQQQQQQGLQPHQLQEAQAQAGAAPAQAPSCPQGPSAGAGGAGGSSAGGSSAGGPAAAMSAGGIWGHEQHQQHGGGVGWADPNNRTACSDAAGCGSSAAACAAAGWGDGPRPHLDRISAAVLDAWPGRQRGYQPTRLLVAGGRDSSWRGLKAVELYDPRSDTWSHGPSLPAALPFAGAGLLGRGQLFVVGGSMYPSALARLDVAAGVWHSHGGPRLPRVHGAVAGCSGLLYLTGGRSQVNQVVAAVEVYDPSAGRWRALPDMQQPRYAHAAAALGGCVYAVGGQATKAIHSSVEVFDAERGAWRPLGQQLLAERKYCAAAALGGRLLVLGGMDETRCRLASAEAYDPREGHWAELAPMQHARSSCGAAALGGRLYVVGGNATDQQLHAAAEEWDPAAGRWRSCQPLGCGRSGLLAAGV